MRLLLALLLVCSIGQAGILKSIKWNAASTNIATTYTNSGANTVDLSTIAPYAGGICCVNRGTSDVALFVDNDTSTSAPTANTQDLYLPAGLTWCSGPNLRISRSIQVRSDSGSALTTVVTGLVSCSIFDRRG